MPHRPRPAARDRPERSRDDRIARLLALALAALAITTIPRILLADLLTAAAWVTLLAALLLTALLLTRQRCAPEQARARARSSPPTRADQQRDEPRDDEQPLDGNSLNSTR